MPGRRESRVSKKIVEGSKKKSDVNIRSVASKIRRRNVKHISHKKLEEAAGAAMGIKNKTVSIFGRRKSVARKPSIVARRPSTMRRRNVARPHELLEEAAGAAVGDQTSVRVSIFSKDGFMGKRAAKFRQRNVARPNQLMEEAAGVVTGKKKKNSVFGRRNSVNKPFGLRQRKLTRPRKLLEEVAGQVTKNMKNMQKNDSLFLSEPSEKEEKPHITMSELVIKLNVQPELRVEEDIKLSADAIYEFIKSVPAFEEGFMKTDAMAIARHAELKTVDKNQTVFLQGEFGRNFYFVLQGSVAIKINNRMIKILGDKTAFGEIAMQCNVRRSASVLGAEKATKLLVIRRKIYHRHLAKPHRKQMVSKLNFLKKLNATELTADAAASLCTCIKMKKVTKNQTICSFNEPANFLYYMIKGCAEQHSLNNEKLLNQLLEEEEENTFDTVVEKKAHEVSYMPKMQKNHTAKLEHKEPEMHRLATLLEGQLFGEASWVYGQQVKTTVIARSDCKLWVLSFAHVDKIAKNERKALEHLAKMARMKLQFRLRRFAKLKRACRSLQLVNVEQRNRNVEKDASACAVESKLLSAQRSSFCVQMTTVDNLPEKANLNMSKSRKRPRSFPTPRDRRPRGVVESKMASTPQCSSPSSQMKPVESATNNKVSNENTAPRPFLSSKQSLVTSRVRRPASAKPSQEGLAQSPSLGELFKTVKPLPRLSDADSVPKQKKQQSKRSCDQLIYRVSDKYNRNSGIPREVLASVVDVFNSGSPYLDKSQQQLVKVLGNYLNRKSNSPKNKKSNSPKNKSNSPKSKSPNEDSTRQ